MLLVEVGIRRVIAVSHEEMMEAVVSKVRWKCISPDVDVCG